MNEAIKTKNLTKRYNKFTLNNVDFIVPKGSIVGIIGENGAGKTTLIKLILNLVKRDGGSIDIFGLDNLKNEKKIKGQIGVVMDDSFFYENVNTGEINTIMKRFRKNSRLYHIYTQR